jgi:spermidine/putrescine transport system permease protein
VKKVSGSRIGWLALPAAGWLVWFLFVPLLIVFAYSLATKGMYGGVVMKPTLESYLRATDFIYLRILGNSVKLAFITTLSCLLIGYPMAYVMATAKPQIRALLLVLVVIPFWTNFVIRAYALKVLFGEHGPLSLLGMKVGLLREPLELSSGSFAVWLGMVTNYLPFMVLPLYVALEKFDFNLIEAARDLGAKPFDVLWNVLLPLTKPGIVTGVLFVFTPALGEFVIPDLLGGARTMLIGNLITEQFLKTRDWPFGSAMSLLLIALVMISLILYLKSEASSLEAKGI